MKDARSNSNIWINRNRPLKVLVSAVTVVAFLFSTISYDLAWAIASPPEPAGVSPEKTGAPGLFKLLNVDTFILPEYMGYLRDSFKAPRSNKVVIYIQDAHCNYYAQHKISEIIEYVNNEYGINTVNLEGGAMGYDLSPFTNIADKSVRERASDHFVRAGLVNGAEYFAINNPEKVSLWGAEDVRLYVDNLNTYRNSIKHKEEIDKAIKSLSYILTNLKMHIYSKDLLEFDAEYLQYKAGSIEFKDYLRFLLDTAKTGMIDVKHYKNIYLLNQALGAESGIDFKKANDQRDALIDKLQKTLSRNSLEGLLAKTVDFKMERISQREFYAYLLKKAATVKVDLSQYPELQKYIVYISLYDAVDKASIMEETDALEDAIRTRLYQNDTQKELATLSKNLALIKNLFGISMTKEDYNYYKANESSFAARNFTKFIEKEAPLYKITAQPDPSVNNLDSYREDMSAFYEYSLERDNAFMANIRFGKPVIARSTPRSSLRGREAAEAISKTAILVTGGFHTENLAELFKKQNISYISIMPNFRSPEGYECEYYKILSGQDKLRIKEALPSVIKSSLATPPQLCPAIDAAVTGQVAAPAASIETDGKPVKPTLSESYIDALKSATPPVTATPVVAPAPIAPSAAENMADAISKELATKVKEPTPPTTPSKANILALRTFLVDRLGLERQFTENILIPVIEEGIMFLLLSHFGIFAYVLTRAVFVLLHANQGRAPPELGRSRTLWERIAVPLLSSIAPTITAIMGLPAEYALYSGLFGHILGNTLIDMYPSGYQKGMIGQASREKARAEDMAKLSAQFDPMVEDLNRMCGEDAALKNALNIAVRIVRGMNTGNLEEWMRAKGYIQGKRVVWHDYTHIMNDILITVRTLKNAQKTPGLKIPDKAIVLAAIGGLYHDAGYHLNSKFNTLKFGHEDRSIEFIRGNLADLGLSGFTPSDVERIIDIIQATKMRNGPKFADRADILQKIASSDAESVMLGSIQLAMKIIAVADIYDIRPNGVLRINDLYQEFREDAGILKGVLEKDPENADAKAELNGIVISLPSKPGETPLQKTDGFYKYVADKRTTSLDVVQYFTQDDVNAINRVRRAAAEEASRVTGEKIKFVPFEAETKAQAPAAAPSKEPVAISGLGTQVGETIRMRVPEMYQSGTERMPKLIERLSDLKYQIKAAILRESGVESPIGTVALADLAGNSIDAVMERLDEEFNNIDKDDPEAMYDFVGVGYVTVRVFKDEKTGAFSIVVSNDGNGIPSYIMNGWAKGEFMSTKRDKNPEDAPIYLGARGQGVYHILRDAASNNYAVTILTRREKEKAARVFQQALDGSQALSDNAVRERAGTDVIITIPPAAGITPTGSKTPEQEFPDVYISYAKTYYPQDFSDYGITKDAAESFLKNLRYTEEFARLFNSSEAVFMNALIRKDPAAVNMLRNYLEKRSGFDLDSSGETGIDRYTAQDEVVIGAVSEMLKKKGSVKIFYPGVSTGDSLLSLAAKIARDIPGSDGRVTIYGVDKNGKTLNMAKKYLSGERLFTTFDILYSDKAPDASRKLVNDINSMIPKVRQADMVRLIEADAASDANIALLKDSDIVIMNNFYYLLGQPARDKIRAALREMRPGSFFAGYDVNTISGFTSQSTISAYEFIGMGFRMENAASGARAPIFVKTGPTIQPAVAVEGKALPPEIARAAKAAAEGRELPMQNVEEVRAGNALFTDRLEQGRSLYTKGLYACIGIGVCIETKDGKRKYGLGHLLAGDDAFQSQLDGFINKFMDSLGQDARGVDVVMYYNNFSLKKEGGEDVRKILDRIDLVSSRSGVRVSVTKEERADIKSTAQMSVMADGWGLKWTQNGHIEGGESSGRWFEEPIVSPIKEWPDASGLRLTIVRSDTSGIVSPQDAYRYRRDFVADLDVCVAVAAYNVKDGQRLLAHLLPNGYIYYRGENLDKKGYMDRLLPADVNGPDWKIAIVEHRRLKIGDPISAADIKAFLRGRNISEDAIILDSTVAGDSEDIFKRAVLDANGNVRSMFLTEENEDGHIFDKKLSDGMAVSLKTPAIPQSDPQEWPEENHIRLQFTAKDIAPYYMPRSQLRRDKMRELFSHIDRNVIAGMGRRYSGNPMSMISINGHIIPNAIDAVFDAVDRGIMDIKDARIDFDIYVSRDLKRIRLEVTDNGVGVTESEMRGWSRGEFGTLKPDPVLLQSFLGGRGFSMRMLLSEELFNANCALYVESKSGSEKANLFVQNAERARYVGASDKTDAGTRAVIIQQPDSGDYTTPGLPQKPVAQIDVAPQPAGRLFKNGMEGVRDVRLKKILEAITRVEKQFGEGAIVVYGGAVRDLVSGKETRMGGDIDLLVRMDSEDPEDIKKVEDILSAFEAEIGLKPGVFAANEWRGAMANDGIFIDILGGYNPSSYSITPRQGVRKFIGNIQLSINTMFMKSDTTVIDQYNGSSDLQNGVIRFVGSDPATHLNPVSVLNAVRFKYQLKADFDKETGDIVRGYFKGLEGGILETKGVSERDRQFALWLRGAQLANMYWKAKKEGDLKKAYALVFALLGWIQDTGQLAFQSRIKGEDLREGFEGVDLGMIDDIKGKYSAGDIPGALKVFEKEFMMFNGSRWAKATNVRIRFGEKVTDISDIYGIGVSTKEIFENAPDEIAVRDAAKYLEEIGATPLIEASGIDINDLMNKRLQQLGPAPQPEIAVPVPAEKTKILPTVPVAVGPRATVAPAKTTFGSPVGITPKPEAATLMETWSKQTPIVMTALDQVEAAKAVIGDLSQNKTDIIVMPGNEIYIPKQNAVGKAVSDKLHKDYGQETLPYNYRFAEGRIDGLFGKKGVIYRAAEALKDRKEEDDARMIIYVPSSAVDEVKDYVGREHADIAGKIYVVGEAEGSIPKDGIIDTVMHIVLGKGLLNYARYGNTMEPEAVGRLVNLIEKLAAAKPGEITPAMINDLLKGIKYIRIVPVNFKDIEDWKKSQDEVLRAL